VAIIDLQVILITTIIDAFIDLIIFKLFRVRGITMLVSVLVNFIIPYISFWLLIQSGIPLTQQVQAIADFLVFYITNLVNFMISSFFGIVISAIISIFTGERPQEF
jgi:hypothetical protein